MSVYRNLSWHRLSIPIVFVFSYFQLLWTLWYTEASIILFSSRILLGLGHSSFCWFPLSWSIDFEFYYAYKRCTLHFHFYPFVPFHTAPQCSNLFDPPSITHIVFMYSHQLWSYHLNLGKKFDILSSSTISYHHHISVSAGSSFLHIHPLSLRKFRGDI